MIPALWHGFVKSYCSGVRVNFSKIYEFLKNIDIKILINKRGTSWRKLSDKEKKTSTKLEIIDLLFENPTIMKRPIIKTKKKYLVGFDKEKFKLLK